MRKLILAILTVVPLLAQTVSIENFKTDIFSKNSQNLKKIKVDLVFDINTTIPTPEYKLKDAINIVISSFYVESLFTSQTKESFKNLLTNYLSKKHDINVSSIYITDMQILNQIDLDELVEKLKNKKVIKNEKSKED